VPQPHRVRGGRGRGGVRGPQCSPGVARLRWDRFVGGWNTRSGPQSSIWRAQPAGWQEVDEVYPARNTLSLACLPSLWRACACILDTCSGFGCGRGRCGPAAIYSGRGACANVEGRHGRLFSSHVRSAPLLVTADSPFTPMDIAQPADQEGRCWPLPRSVQPCKDLSRFSHGTACAS
jgi:hypothetical protein